MYFEKVLYCAILAITIVPGTIQETIRLHPQYSLSSRCNSADRERIARCEDDARKDWDIRDYDMNKPSRKFCCFIWDTLSCELGVAQKCDPDYASRLSYLTEQNMGSICEWHGRRSVSCALRWWSVSLIIIAIVAIFAIAAFVAFRRRQGRVSHGYDTTRRLP